MNNEAVLAVLASVVVLGAALVAVLRTDRVRETRQHRLKAVTAMAPIGEQPTVSLRRVSFRRHRRRRHRRRRAVSAAAGSVRKNTPEKYTRLAISFVDLADQ